MVGCEQRKFVTARSVSNALRGRKPLVGISGGAHKIGVLNFVRQIDLEPVSRIKLGDIGLQALGRPVFHSLAEFVLGDRHALGAVDFRESTREHGLSFVVERANELRSSSRSTRRGPTARISAVVRIVSSFSRSAD